MIQPKTNNKAEIKKAYDFAIDNSLISKIHELKKDLFFQKIKIHNTFITSYIYSTKNGNVEYFLSQLFNLNLLNTEFNKKILLSLYNKKTFSHPLPFSYISMLVSKNIKINKINSFLKYTFYIYKIFFASILYNIKIIKQILIDKKPNLSKNKSIYFADLLPGCIPFYKDNNRYNIINWFIINNKNDDIYEIRHNINSSKEFIKDGFTIKSEIPPSYYLQKFDEKLKFLVWSIISFFYNFLCLISFKFSNVIVYNHAIQAKLYNLTNIQYLPAEIYFSISSFSLKPLWTYVVEEKNSKVINYTYASSFQGFKTKSGYIDQEYFFENIKWNNIYLWSKDYSDYVISRVTKNVNVQLVNPIFYSDSNYIVEKSNTSYLGVFDVTPLETDVSYTYLPEIAYRNTENSIKFLNDIYEVALLNDYKLLWKRKRKFHPIHSKEYINFCLEFENRKNVLVVDSEASAFKVIQHCKVCISMPFTSTALIAEHYKIKSIYYDPTGLLFLNDRGAQGIKLIQNKNNLLNYLKNA
jgi:polysaccharide biosynthesis PFTS motif protein